MKRKVLHWLWLGRCFLCVLRRELKRIWSESALPTDEEMEFYDFTTKDKR